MTRSVSIWFNHTHAPQNFAVDIRGHGHAAQHASVTPGIDRGHAAQNA
jgi:hypothetical protein